MKHCWWCLSKLLISDEEEKKPSIASLLFRSIVWSSDVANRPQLLKYREILNLARTQDTNSIYNNISTSPETREVVLLIEEIRLKLARLDALKTSLYLNLVTPYDTISSKYLRVMELKYKCEYNIVRLKDMGAENLLSVSYYKGERSAEIQLNNQEKVIPAKCKDDWRLSLEELQIYAKRSIQHALMVRLKIVTMQLKIVSGFNILPVRNHSQPKDLLAPTMSTILL